MSTLTLVKNDRRNHSRRCQVKELDKDNERSATNDRRQSISIPLDAVQAQLDLCKHEYGLLWDQVDRRDKQRVLLLRSALGIFSVFIAGLGAYFMLAHQSGKPIEPTFGFVILFSLVLIGMGAANIAVIKYIISFQHARILLMRQLNCLRHQMDACIFAMVQGYFPNGSAILTKGDDEYDCPDTPYYQAFGKHRKLPVDNEWLRTIHKDLFESPDIFSIRVIGILTAILLMLPPTYIAVTHNNAISGLVSGAIAVVCFLVFRSVKRSSEIGIDNALSLNQSESGSMPSLKDGCTKRVRERKKA